MKYIATLAVMAVLGVQPLHALSISGIDSGKIEIPMPVMSDMQSSGDAAAVKAPAVQTGAVTNGNTYLLAVCSANNIIGYPKTQEEYAAFYSAFSAMLSKAGIKITSAKFDANGSVISYDANGLVLRRFIGDELAYDGSNSAAIAASRDAMKSALTGNGLKIAAEYTVNADIFRPTYALYYFTKAAARDEDETQLRILNASGDDIDYDLLSGVNIISKENSWLMAYLDREVGFVTAAGTDSANIAKKLQDRTDYLAANGKKIIGSRIFPVSWTDLPDYHFVYHLYFYQ